MVVESPPQQKNDEQYPLLKVEAGGGDSGRAPTTAALTGWNVRCSPKKSCLDRWPEFISACWMTLMLLGIFFLILYGIGIGMIRRQSLFLLCNETQAERQVFYHHIVHRGKLSPTKSFSKYLSNMASLYSSLQFNVLFLINDNTRPYYSSYFMDKLIPSDIVIDANKKFHECHHPTELNDFRVKNHNVNVTIMPLSKFMASTPLRYKWKVIPMEYLTFYARVFSVWQNGGIGIDLNLYSKQYSRGLQPDRRISEILKQYNNGIKPDEFADKLNNIDRDEKQNELVSLIFNVLHQFFNETKQIFNRSIYPINNNITQNLDIPESQDHTRRNERAIYNNSGNYSSKYNIKQRVVNNETDIPKLPVIDTPHTNIVQNSTDKKTKKDFIPPWIQTGTKKTEITTNPNSKLLNVSEPQILLLYDFSLYTDNSIGPPYAMSQPNLMPVFPMQSIIEDDVSVQPRKIHYTLSVSTDGSFITAFSKRHPFLTRILSGGCIRLPPRLTMQDAILSQCSSLIKDDSYCASIYIFDNIVV